MSCFIFYRGGKGRMGGKSSADEGKVDVCYIVLFDIFSPLVFCF